MRTNNTKAANQAKPILKILSILAILVQTIVFTACSNDGGDNTFDYCLLTEAKICLRGAYDSSTCNGQLSNNCPTGFDVDSQPSSSSGGNGGGIDASGNGGKDSFNTRSQIYDIESGARYTGSGDIKIKLWRCGRRVNGECYEESDTLINAGSVVNGIVNLQLPATIPDRWLVVVDDEECAISPRDVKITGADFRLYIGGEDSRRLGIRYVEEDETYYYGERIDYYYSSKAATVTCNYNYHDHDWTKVNATFQAGWNKMYDKSYSNESTRTYTDEISTNNILTKDVRWVIDHVWGDDEPDPYVPSSSSGGWTEPNATPLTSDYWNEGVLTASAGEAWYSFYAYSDEVYYIWLGDSDNGGGTVDAKYAAYYSNGTVIFDSDNSGSDYKSFIASSSGIVYVKVYPYSGSSGTFKVMYSNDEHTNYDDQLQYQGQTYKTISIPINNQTYIAMAENLNYAVAGSKCYGEGGEVYLDDEDRFVTISSSEIQSNCAKYGRLYDWATAMALPAGCNSSACASQVSAKHQGICPAGWHILSNDEWDALFHYADGTSGSGLYDSHTAGRYLKATSGWNWNDWDNISGNGTDSYGFAALPGGHGYSADGNFYVAGYFGYWWSSSEYDESYAYNRYMGYDIEYALWAYNDKANLFSVRCVKDFLEEYAYPAKPLSKGLPAPAKTRKANTFAKKSNYWR